ncbi:hypothetical protein H6P81_016994 [Aristolochia fimbriata]|uniref:Uncharacterized protein n=1 Tax=Aristolochia fimbriata TaxID=158543 RepID=A0AAV7DWW1_ARIFI|nr:hypothetical protein H6P81_016994 [Aristolochia fimbriata]
MSMESKEKAELHDCTFKLRRNALRRKNKLYIGCGAGFGGDRPVAALKLLQNVKLDYLVLECLAERTLADRYQTMMCGDDGFDSRILDWMSLLLPLAVQQGVCIVTNMGAMDPLGAQEKVLDLGSSLGLIITVAVAYEVTPTKPGVRSLGVSTYLGASPIVECLELYQPNVIITSRVADAALFLGPMVYELGWQWNDFKQLAQGSLAGHLLECGCQLTGGYYMHPGDEFRDLSFQQLLNLSLPFAEVHSDGRVFVAKADNSGGVLNFRTCAQQLLYEIGDPSAYVTPDMIVDFRDVYFHPLSNDRVSCLGAKPSDQSFPHKLLQLAPKDCGWKGWGEISYGGFECVSRAQAAEFLVRSWMEELSPGVSDKITSYIIGLDSLKASDINEKTSCAKHSYDIRLRLDGLFEKKEHAIQLVREFTALYTNGPAGGGGISTGYKKEIILLKELVERESVYWKTEANRSTPASLCTPKTVNENIGKSDLAHGCPILPSSSVGGCISCSEPTTPAPSGQAIPLYKVAHSRAGDKGNDLNFSIIPHFPLDIERLKAVITSEWVKEVVSPLLDSSSFPQVAAVQKRNNWVKENLRVEIYEAKGIHSLNIVVRNILDGGVNCSRRIDRHGKCISDLILCQQVVLPPV